ncbi:MAG: type II toxin-antitoxin system HicA family toxin [Ignavibacteriae bacterium]|nr:type II toxin-antitoxin system HicA family toxin [Ignavibacteriota bacterium]
MPKPRRLSGDDIISILEHFGFVVRDQRGSHVKMRRISGSGSKQTLTIPRHKEVDSGTIRGIFKQASRYIPEEDLFPHFFV